MQRAIVFIRKATQNISPVRYSIGLLIAFLGITVFLHYDNVPNYQFSEEIGNVAASVVQGNGFSNVFARNSGPTAWCPPLYVGFYAMIFKVFGVKSLTAAWAIYMIRCMFLALTFYFIIKIDYGRFNPYKGLILPVFLLYTALIILVKKPDDVFLQVFLSASLLYYLSRFVQLKQPQDQLPLLLLALLVPLSNISLFMGMLLIVILFIALKLLRISDDGSRTGYKLTIILLLLVTVSVWGYRNKLVLNEFVPFKSNLWFELYLANIKDEDGISKWSNFRKYHPLGNEQVRASYIQQGETEFLHFYKEESLNYLKHNLSDFICNVLNRSKEAFIMNTSQKDVELINSQMLLAGDIKKLQDANLVAMDFWVCLELSEEQAFSRFEALDLVGIKSVKSDWTKKATKAKNRVARRDSLKEYVKSLFTSLVPALAIIIGLVFKPIRENSVFLMALLLFLLCIGPYVLVSFLPRYLYFQLTFMVILTFFSLAYLTNRIDHGLES